MRFVEYPDREAMMIDLADLLASELNEALHHGDRATLVVPGGTTPGPVFDTLSAVDLPWDKIDVMLSDERWVPETSDRSNTRLLKERLFTGRAAAAHFIPLYADADAPEHRLAELSQRVQAALPISVLLLGMGDDMHTASLFPGADQLDLALADDAPTLVAMRAPGAPEPRITLSAPVLAAAQNTHIVITGAAKRTSVELAASLDDPHQAPVCTVLKSATVHWAE